MIKICCPSEQNKSLEELTLTASSIMLGLKADQVQICKHCKPCMTMFEAAS